MIRKAKPGDEYGIFKLIQALAEYEKAPEQVTNTPEILGKDLFEEKVCDALVAEENNQIVGFALWYTSYSTWKGQCLYLEDFYVLQEFRSLKIGSKLFDEVVKIAQEQGVKRMDWQVLEWNELALDFYRRKNALLDSEWVNGRLFF
ncbi:MAG: GNAT family N-acetyltransferase [Flavobacteriia bacterium]|jgi:GNAT superfamily N-acetyltransferase